MIAGICSLFRLDRIVSILKRIALKNEHDKDEFKSRIGAEILGKFNAEIECTQRFSIGLYHVREYSFLVGLLFLFFSRGYLIIPK